MKDWRAGEVGVVGSPLVDNNRSQLGGCGPNAGMKDWRAGEVGVVGSPLVDNNSTKGRRFFLERRHLGDDFKCRGSCKRCFGLRVLF